MRNDACGLPLKKEKTMMLRKTQNQNDADDANDAESGIWYRDILKTASRASSASLSSRKNCAGGLGYAPEMCMWMTTCYASKTRLPLKRWQSNSMPIQIRIFPRVNRPLIHWKYLTCRSESMIDSLCPQKRNVAKIQPIAPEWISLDSFKNLDSKKWISSDSRCN